MNRLEIIEAVNRVLIDGFEKDPAKLVPAAHLFTDLGIDSLDAVDMLVFLEEKIGRTVSPMLFKNVRRLSDIYDVVETVVTGVPVGAAGIPADLVAETPAPESSDRL